MTTIVRNNDHNLRKQISEALTALETQATAIGAAPIVLQAANAAVPGGLVLTAGANVTLTSGPGTLTVAASGGAGTPGPSAEQFIYAFAGSASTSTDSTQKRVVGEFYFDPTDADLGTDGSSVATFEVVIATSAGANTVNCDLLQETGTGSPAVIATVTPSASTTAVLVSVDVSAAFRPTTGVAGIFAPRLWLTINTGNDYATCTMARVRLVP